MGNFIFFVLFPETVVQTMHCSRYLQKLEKKLLTQDYEINLETSRRTFKLYNIIMSQPNTTRSEEDSEKNQLYWKSRKFHRTSESVNFLEKCLAENISPRFVRLSTNAIQENNLPFSAVKRIEMKNVQRELLCQKKNSHTTRKNVEKS